jgi:hypothetical protein
VWRREIGREEAASFKGHPVARPAVTVAQISKTRSSRGPSFDLLARRRDCDVESSSRARTSAARIREWAPLEPFGRSLDEEVIV